MSEMIKTQQLKYRYAQQNALQFPDLTCSAGEVFLVTGNSGTGKTTLLHLMGGLLLPTEGYVRVNGQVLSDLSARKLDRFRGKHVGFVLQKNYFVATLSVLENVMLSQWLAQGKKDEKEVMQLLERLDVAQQSHKKPSELSIGQQQRISIARALINKPNLILADEPTSSLDDVNAEIVADLITGISHDVGAAVVVVTHDQRLKKTFSNHITLQV